MARLDCGVAVAQWSQHWHCLGWLSFFLKHPKSLNESTGSCLKSSYCLSLPDWSPHPTKSSWLMPLTFVPDQIVSKEDKQNEQQEDNESHNPSDDGMVGTGGWGHRTGVCREKRHIVRTGTERTFSSHADLALDTITEETSTSGESRRYMQAQGTCLSLCSGEYHHAGNVVILERKKSDVFIRQYTNQLSLHYPSCFLGIKAWP